MANYSPKNNIVGQLYTKSFYVLFTYHVIITLQIRSSSNNLIEKNDHLKLMASVLRWWQLSNVPEILRCKYTAIPIYTAHKLLNMTPVHEIKSFPCTEDEASPPFYFDGIIKNGYLEGRGKLVFIGEKEWSKQSPLDIENKERMALASFKVCLKASFFQGKGIKEIAGTFKNGSLHGLAKVTYTDNSLSIGSYKNGKVHGYKREFDPKNNLLDAGGYEIGLKAGSHWSVRFGHLLYQDREIFNDDVRPTILFPIADDGSLNEPIAGDYFQHSGSLENIHKVELIRILSSSSKCLLNMEYKLSDKENYTYSLCSKTRYPLFGQHEHKLLCNINKSYQSYSAAKKLEHWIQSINKLLDVQQVHDGQAIYSPLEILWQLRPELEQLDEDDSIRLISDVNFNIEKQCFTAKILGSPAVKVLFAADNVRLDSDFKLNGFNDVLIATEDQNLVPRDKTLSWSPTRIIGRFDHGLLNGLAFLHTNIGTFVWAITKNGILHGPCVIWRISYVIEPVSNIQRLRLL